MVDIREGVSDPVTAEDLDVFFDAFVVQAQRHYEASGEHPPILIALRGNAVLVPVNIEQFLEGPGAALLPGLLRALPPEAGCDGYLVISETWQVLQNIEGMTPEQVAKVKEDGVAASEHPDKFEALSVWMVSKAVTPRYCRVRSMRIAKGKVLSTLHDRLEKPGDKSGGIVTELLP